MVAEAKRLSKRDDEVAPGAVAYAVTKPVTLEALSAGLREEFGNAMGVTVEGDPSAASEEHPVTVWVSGGEITPNDFKRVLKEHHGADEPRTATERPSFLDKPQDEPFTDDEIQQALRYLLERGSDHQ